MAEARGAYGGFETEKTLARQFARLHRLVEQSDMNFGALVLLQVKTTYKNNPITNSA